MSQELNNDNLTEPESPHFSLVKGADEVAPWTEIESGRFMPRRVRGSYQGRALG